MANQAQRQDSGTGARSSFNSSAIVSPFGPDAPKDGAGRGGRPLLRAAAATVLALAVSACGTAPYRYQDNCLNGSVSPNYGEVSATPDGGFEVSGSGVRHTPIVVSQVAPNLRPGTAGDPADDYPRPKQRGFECRPVESR